MKLMYDLPDTEKQVYSSSSSAGERIMYCVPYNIEGDKFVSGFVVITDRFIYRICRDRLMGRFDLSHMSDFSAEMLYGNAAFYGKTNGVSVLICRFVSGRHLARYSVLVNACELLCERVGKDPGEPVTSSENERYCPKCGRPFIRRTTICPACRDKKEVYSKLWKMTKGMRLIMFFPVFMSVFLVALRFIVPAIQKIAVNGYINPGDGVQAGPVKSFLVIVLAIASLDVLHRILLVVQSRVASISGNKFTIMMRTLLYEKIQNLSMSSIGRRSTGDLMGRINHDVNVVKDFMVSQLPNLFINAFSFVFALLIMLWLNWIMCLFIFVPIPIVVFIIYRFWKTIESRNRKRWILSNRTNRLLQDVLNGIRVVKSFGREEYENERFTKSVIAATDKTESNDRFYVTLFPLLGFLVHIGSYLILLYGSICLFGGTLDYGSIHQYNTYANLVYEPLLWITSIPKNISDFLTSLGKVLEILEEEPEVTDAKCPRDIKLTGSIEFRHVSFGYESYNPVLKDINFKVNAGESVGIVGHSGCGKTTLINLLMRLYEVSEGAILVDGVNLKELSQNALRSQIGVVLQETHLFSGSVRDNIRYAKPYATDEEVVRAARLSNSHDFITALPEGYNTIVGEKGYSLSGGERQRIALARALIHDPRILILDEATAALDTETEKLVQDAVSNIMQGRTTIAIAHRLSTLRDADRIIVFDHGRLAEMGTHRELLDRRGIYYKLCMAQQEMAARREA